MTTPLRIARAAAVPTTDELAARAARRGRRGPLGTVGITGGELAARLRALGRQATHVEVCRWEKSPREQGAVIPSAESKAFLEQALGLPAGALSRPLCPTCGGTGIAV